MRLAWCNLIHDRLRFLVTVVGVAFAVFLMVFQGSLLAGFLRAASKGVDLTDSDLWITARGVDCFEFATPLPDRFREMAMGVQGVHSVQHVAVGFAYWRKPSGTTQMVLLVGAEPGVGRMFPLPYMSLRSGSAALNPQGIIIDRSNAAALGIETVPAAVEVNDLRATVVGTTDRVGSFFGTPYVFTGYADAAQYLRLRPEETTYLTVRIVEGYPVAKVRAGLRRALPEADVWTRQEFSRRARVFWVLKTGAGGALLTAAFLGFLVGLVIVSQSIYATTMENVEEFATLKALGASRRYVRGVVLRQSLACGVVGSLIGLGVTYPSIQAVRGSIAWIHTPWWLPVGMIGLGLVMCALASLASIRTALEVEPAKVFRA